MSVNFADCPFGTTILPSAASLDRLTCPCLSLICSQPKEASVATPATRLVFRITVQVVFQHFPEHRGRPSLCRRIRKVLRNLIIGSKNYKYEVIEI